MCDKYVTAPKLYAPCTIPIVHFLPIQSENTTGDCLRGAAREEQTPEYGDKDNSGEGARCVCKIMKVYLQAHLWWSIRLQESIHVRKGTGMRQCIPWMQNHAWFLKCKRHKVVLRCYQEVWNSWVPSEPCCSCQGNCKALQTPTG